MASSKTILAVGLAAATLVVFVVVIAMGGVAGWARAMAGHRRCRPGDRCVRCLWGAQIRRRGGTAWGERRRRRRVWLDQNGILDGQFVSWSDLRNHPWASDTRAGRGRGRWSHPGPKKLLKTFARSGDTMRGVLAAWRDETNRLPPQRPWSA